jgi:outer membrane protein TolC
LKNKVAGYDVAVATYNQSLTDALHEVADQLQTLQTSEAQAKQQVIAEQAAKTPCNSHSNDKKQEQQTCSLY